VAFEKAAYQVRTASNGYEALELVKEFAPDLILLDIVMPGMDGYEVLARLRSRFRTSQIPVIFLTLKKDLEDKVEGLRKGVDDYITKPFYIDELQARVTSTLIKNSALRTQHPLTGLPGNVAIQKETQRRMNEDSHVWIYVDIDNFRHYNNHYGFLRGDAVIKFVADLLIQALEEKGEGSDFLGHVGGDDFLIITSEDKVTPITDFIIAGVQKGSPRFFDADDVTAGNYEYLARNNVRTKVPAKLSLTMAVLSNEGREFSHPAELSTIAAQVKEWGKSIEGNVVVFNRRQHPGRGEPQA
jgi:CheY-like chemotaxis protein